MKAIRNFLLKISSLIRRGLRKIKFRREKINAYIDKNPNRSFYIFLGLLVILIVISNILGNPKAKNIEQRLLTKKVDFYSVGRAPQIEVLATIEKSGVVTLTALSPGVVQSINKSEGSTVNRGEIIISLSSNYQGGNTASLQRSLAQTQYQNILDTFDAQKELIKKQKELSEKADANSDELRDITDKSVDETNDLINLNSEIISSLDTNIQALVSTNVGTSNDALILSSKQLKSQFVAATNAARQGVRMAEYNASAEKPPSDLSNLQKDVTLKQLEIQEKMLDLNKEVSSIQLKIARIVESLMFPSSPISGTVQRISVKVGQSVSPGMELAVIGSNSDKYDVDAVAYISSDIAKKISKIDLATVHLNSSISYKAQPVFVSSDPVKDTLHAVYFKIPTQYTKDTSDKSYIKINLPLGYADTGTSIPYIPIDSVYQTKESNYVFIDESGVAKSRKLELGNVFGSYVEVVKGLSSGSQIIVNRNVIEGDKVESNVK